MFFLIDSNQKVKAGYTDLDAVAVNGFRVVSVPSQVQTDPQDVQHAPPLYTYQDLIRQKVQGILANNPEFASVTYDDLLDASGWDLPNSQGFGVGNGNYWLQGSTSQEASLRTVEIPLPGPVSRFKLVWDVYEVVREQRDGFNLLFYRSVDSDLLGASVSTELANPFVSVFNDQPITLTPGDSIRIEFSSPQTSQRYYLGGWALLY